MLWINAKKMIAEATKFRRRNDTAYKFVYHNRESIGDVVRLADFALEQVQIERKRIAVELQSIILLPTFSEKDDRLKELYQEIKSPLESENDA